MTHSIRPTICLLIDDDVDDQEIFGMALQEISDNISCSVETDAMEAIEKLTHDDAFQPHCIFIDINMPRMNGVECLEHIKNIDRLKKTPVCMISTSADPSIVSQTKTLGAIDFIVKPPSIGVLSELLKDFLHVNVGLK